MPSTLFPQRSPLFIHNRHDPSTLIYGEPLPLLSRASEPDYFGFADHPTDRIVQTRTRRRSRDIVDHSKTILAPSRFSLIGGIPSCAVITVVYHHNATSVI